MTHDNNRLKFRIWNHQTNSYRYFNLAIQESRLALAAYAQQYDAADLCWEYCTGLFDSGDILIYEGDTLTGTATVDEGSFKYCGTVEWNDQSELIGWYVCDKYGNGWELKQVHAKISSDNVSGKIIGNIHQNKQILAKLK